MKPLFQDEVQLAGWSDSHTGGAKVTFWLSDPAQLEAFRLLTIRKGNTAGQRMACVLVEIGDDEKPVPPPEAGNPASEKPGPLCMEAIGLCKHPEFYQWAMPVYDRLLGGNGFGSGDIDATEMTVEAFSAHAIKVICNVDSRKELDTDPSAGRRFVELIRVPFLKRNK
jgi:hypothetical protein